MKTMLRLCGAVLLAGVMTLGLPATDPGPTGPAAAEGATLTQRPRQRYRNFLRRQVNRRRAMAHRAQVSRHIVRRDLRRLIRR